MHLGDVAIRYMENDIVPDELREPQREVFFANLRRLYLRPTCLLSSSARAEIYSLAKGRYNSLMALLCSSTVSPSGNIKHLPSNVARAVDVNITGYFSPL